MSITGLPQREGNKERRGMWGHGRSLPSPPPTAAEAEGGGEPARETPWSEPIPGGAPQAHSAAPTAIPPPPHRAQCTPPGAIPGRPTCLSIDLKTRYRSRLVRISPALPNVKPCGEGHATGRRLVRGPAAADTRERDVGSAPGQDTKPESPVSRLGGSASQTATTSVARHQQRREDLVLKLTLPLPNQPAGPSRIYKELVPLSPFPLPLLSLSNQGLPLRKLGTSCSQGKGIRL